MKLVDSDWLRGVQFYRNTEPKWQKGNVMPKKNYTWKERKQTNFSRISNCTCVLLTGAILMLFEKRTRARFFQIALVTMLSPIHIQKT